MTFTMRSLISEKRNSDITLRIARERTGSRAIDQNDRAEVDTRIDVSVIRNDWFRAKTVANDKRARITKAALTFIKREIIKIFALVDTFSRNGR